METKNKKMGKIILFILLLILAIAAVLFAIPKTGICCRIFGHDIYHEIKDEPTCKEEGVARIKCRKCGKTLDVIQVERKEHNYKDGVCTVCGEKDPTYLPEIETDTGKPSGNTTPGSNTAPGNNTPYTPPSNNDQGNTGGSGNDAGEGELDPEPTGNGRAYINENGDIVLPELP